MEFFGSVGAARLFCGDCADLLRAMPDNSVDSVVTDPPYGLKFMGKAWDHGVPSAEVWREVLRVLKPGGYLLAFAGTRTQHRMACNIEDAGFEIRDMIAWTYGSGFPKSHNGPWGGTALKPALEPITMARKPLAGTVAANVQAWGVGGLRVDDCRVPSDRAPAPTGGAAGGQTWNGDNCGLSKSGEARPVNGRWPANLIHDGSDCGLGAASRFFYCAKASKADRNDGLEGMPSYSPSYMTGGRKPGSSGLNDPRAGAGRTSGSRNPHPTVKPTDLMRYLCRLVTPPGGTVLDPFTGSGSTGRGAVLEGLAFVGCELDRGYCDIAIRRIRAVTL